MNIPTDDNILKLPVQKKPEKLAITLVEKTFDPKACRHHHVIVDEALALLECADCKERLDPLHYIVGVAMKIRGWEFELQQIKRARKLLAERQACRCTFCGKMTRIKI